jgi:hypothetical protein
MRTTFLIPGSGKVVNPDGSKKMDVGFRSYRASAQGILRVPIADTEAIRIIRESVGSSASGVTEDPEVYHNAVLSPERKVAREKARVAAQEIEIQSLREQLKSKVEPKQDKKKES